MNCETCPHRARPALRRSGYTAACVAQMLSLPDAVTLVALRGRLCDELPPATMLTVPLAAAEVEERLLGEHLSLAVINSPQRCVVSGPLAAIAELESTLLREKVKTRRIPIATAPHSALVEPIMDELTGVTLTRNVPRIPLVSGLTGTWMTDADALDPSYWARHLRQPVRFADGLTTLLADPTRTLVEVGPGAGLSSLAQMHPMIGVDRLVCAAMAGPHADTTDVQAALGTVAQLWCRGVEIDWTAFHRAEHRKRIPLPTYPFQRTTHQLETARPTPETVPATTAASDRREVAPPNLRHVEHTLTEIWCDLLGVESVTGQDDFFQSGGNSLLAVQIRNHIGQRLQVHTSVHALLQHPTFGGLLDYVRHLDGLAADTAPTLPTPRSAAPAIPLLVTIQTGAAARPPLFLIQPLGGTVYTYRDLAQDQGSDQGLHAFRASGLEPGEPVYSSIAEIAARNVEELLAFHPRGPFLVGGHSSGGIIAQEMAHQLLDRGCDVPLVIMLDTLGVEETKRFNAHSLQDIIEIFEIYRVTAPRAHQAFRAALDNDPSVREVILTTNEAIRNHHPAPCRSDLLYLRAQGDGDPFSAHLETEWMALFDGTVTVHAVSGNHLTIVEPPNVAMAARIISHHLHLGVSDPVAQPGLTVLAPSGLRIEGITLEDTARLLRLVDDTQSNPPQEIG